MAKASSIELLPDDIRERIQEALRDVRVTQLEVTAEINKLLENRGLPKVSKSAVNRYALRMEDVGKQLRESREMAEMWIGKLGAAPQGKVGMLINEMLRTLAFDLTLVVQNGVIDPDDAPKVAKMLRDLSISMERLESAASTNLDRDNQIRDQERSQAAEAAASVAKQRGLSDEAVNEFRAKILGVAR